MIIKDWNKEIFTIPNLLSLFRLALIPVYMTVYLNAREPIQYYFAGSILAVSCLTDAMDGLIARHYNMISRLGKVLDPLADKVTQFTVTLCLCAKYPSLRSVLHLFLVKETFQLIAGILSLRKGKILPGALTAGKICTTVLFISLILMVLHPSIPNNAIQLICIVDTAFLIISFLCYFFAYFGKYTILEDWKME